MLFSASAGWRGSCCGLGRFQPRQNFTQMSLQRASKPPSHQGAERQAHRVPDTLAPVPDQQSSSQLFNFSSQHPDVFTPSRRFTANFCSGDHILAASSGTLCSRPSTFLLASKPLPLLSIPNVNDRVTERRKCTTGISASPCGSHVVTSTSPSRWCMPAYHRCILPR